MARTKIKVTALAHNAGVVLPTGTTIDQANGMYIDCAELEPETIPANRGIDSAVLVVYNTDGTTDRVITIKAGDDWPAFRRSLGDLAVTVTHSSTVPFVFVLESARFTRSDKTINVDFAASFTGTIQVLLLPKAPFVA